MDQFRGSFTDCRDGKTYRTIKIGNQIWMAENLAFKAKNECWAYNDDEEYVRHYGYLYDWETAKVACPSGWHLPSAAEWLSLIKYLGGNVIAGGKLKEKGWSHWHCPNTGGCNLSRFNALPGGYRKDDGSFDMMGDLGCWWSSSFNDVKTIYILALYSNSQDISHNSCDKLEGYSIRCVKD